MNCQEVRDLIETALDERLSVYDKWRMDLHLSRCRACRDLLAAERAEHAAWFRALNDVSDAPPPQTPADALAARLVASASIPRQNGFFRFRWRRIAALFLFFLGGFVYASWVVGDRLIGDDVEEGASDAAWEKVNAAGSAMEISPEITDERKEESMKPPKIERVVRAMVAGAAVLSGARLVAQALDDYEYYPEGYNPEGTAEVSACSDVMSEPLESRYGTVAVSDGICHGRGLTVLVR